MKWGKAVLSCAAIFLPTSVLSAYDCEHDVVIARVKEVIACEEMMNCTNLGLTGGYEELQRLTAEEARQRFGKSSAKSASDDALLKVPQARHYIEKVNAERLSMMIAGKTAISSIKTTALDYNPRVQRYECAATVDWDAKWLPAVFKEHLFVVLNKHPGATQLLNLDPTGKLFLVLLESTYAGGLPYLQYRTQLKFSVQPSTKSGLSVNVHFPEYPTENAVARGAAAAANRPDTWRPR